ncbi:hypothetical protein QL285_012490 [Trifolium repens]|nr:hypothetical protein QL285_012490 [Trifolium repens]
MCHLCSIFNTVSFSSLFFFVLAYPFFIQYIANCVCVCVREHCCAYRHCVHAAHFACLGERPTHSIGFNRGKLLNTIACSFEGKF